MQQETTMQDETILEHRKLYADTLSTADMTIMREGIQSAYREAIRADRSAAACRKLRGESGATMATQEAREAWDHHHALSQSYETIRAQRLCAAGIDFDVMALPTQAQRQAQQELLNTLPDTWGRSRYADNESRKSAWDQLTDRQKIDAHQAWRGQIAKEKYYV